MQQASRTKLNAIGRGELWHFSGSPPFVAIVTKDSFRRVDWVVRTIITEEQAFKRNLESEDAIVSELIEFAEKDVVKIEDKRWDITFPLLTKKDVHDLLTVARLEASTWKETQKTIRIQLQVSRETHRDKYLDLLRTIMRLVDYDSSCDICDRVKSMIESKVPNLFSVNS